MKHENNYFCGASTGENPVYSEKTVALAQWMAQNKHSLVYGGGKVGLMGVMADTVIANGGYTTGVIPTFLRDREIAHENLSELIIVNNMPERKAKMMLLGDAFIALPGGPGTLEEISEVISWSRIGQNDNPCILYNVNGYFNDLKICLIIWLVRVFLVWKIEKMSYSQMILLKSKIL